MASETECMKLIDEKFQRCYEKAVLEIVCHSSDNMEKLVDRCFLKLHGEYFPGEPVVFRSKAHGKQIKGVVVRQDGSLKQEDAAGAPTEGHSYTVLVGQMEVNGVPEGDLMRDSKLPSKELIKTFIKTYAVRNSLTKNWKLTSEEKAAEYGLKTGSHHADVNQLLLRQQQQPQYQSKPWLASDETTTGAKEDQHLSSPRRVGRGSDTSSHSDTSSPCPTNDYARTELSKCQALNGNTVDIKVKGASRLNDPSAAETVGQTEQVSGRKLINSTEAKKSKAASSEDRRVVSKVKATMDCYVIPMSKMTPSETPASLVVASTQDLTNCSESRSQLGVRPEPLVTNGPPKDPTADVEHQHHIVHGPAENSVTGQGVVSGIKLHGFDAASGAVDIRTSSDSVSVWDSDDDMVLSVVKKQITPSKKNLWIGKVQDGGTGSSRPEESSKRSLVLGQQPKVKKERKKVKIREGKSREKARVVKPRADSSSDDDVALIAYKNPSLSGLKPGGDHDGVQKKVGLKQATLFDLSKKAGNAIQSKACSSPAALTVQQPVIPEVVHKYQKAEAELDFARMQQLILQAATDLSAQQRESLPTQLRAAVREKHDYLELKKKMKFAPAEEKVVIQKQLHAYRLKEAAAKRRIMQMRCEDTDLDLKPLPAARPVELPSEAITFADVLCVTEFIRCYHGLLAPGNSWDDKKMSAEILMQSLVRASAGDTQAVALVGEIMTMLLQTIVSDEELEEMKVLGVPIRDIPVNAYTASEMARLLFCHSARGSTDAVVATPVAGVVSDADDGKRMDDSQTTDNDAAAGGGIAEDLLARLSSCEFPALTPDQNLAILSALCDRVLCSRSAESYVEDKHQECADAWKLRKAEAKLLNPKKSPGEKQANAPGGDDAPQRLSNGADAAKALVPSSSAVPSAVPAGAAALAAATIVADLGGEHSVDSDASDRGAGLAAVLRQRREQAAKSARERELKLQQERIQREREAEVRRLIKQREAVEKQFMESVTTAREVLRCRPLGFDRNHNRYWHFVSAKPGIYVEQGWVGSEMNYRVLPEPEAASVSSDRDVAPKPCLATTKDEAVSPSANAPIACATEPEPRNISEKAVAPNLLPGQDIDLEKTSPQPGRNLWLVYDSQKDIDALLLALHPRGMRENALADSLRVLYPDLVRLIKAATAASVLPAASSAALVSTSSAAASPAARVEEQATAVIRFQEELEDLESRLLSGGLGGVNDFDSWSRSVHSASDINGLAACLIACGEAILPKFLKGMADTSTGQIQASVQHFDTELKITQGAVDQPASGYFKPEASPAAFCIRKWKEAVINTATLSRLHVLLGILEACVRWEKSAENAKCKVCRRKGNEDSLLLCDECNMAFHMHCLRPALSRVPEGEWFCPACKPSLPKRENRVERPAMPASSHCSRDGSLASDDDSSDSETSSQDASDASDEDKDERANCCVCSESGRGLVFCSVCSSSYHLRCHNPPLRCAPVGTGWACSGCRVTGDASSKKRGKQQPRLAKDRRHHRRDASPDVSDKDSEYKSEDNESDDDSNRDAARGTTSDGRPEKRLRGATHERQQSSAKTAVKRATQHSKSRSVTGGQSRGRSAEGPDGKMPAATRTAASRTGKRLRPLKTAANALLDDDCGSASDDQSSSSILPTSRSAKSARTSSSRNAHAAASRSVAVGTASEDDNDEKDGEASGRGGPRGGQRSRTNYNAADRRNGTALASERDRRSAKRRAMSEEEDDECDGSASEEIVSNAGSSRRRQTGAATNQSCRAPSFKQTAICDDSEGDSEQPAKRRQRSQHTYSSTGDHAGVTDGNRRRLSARQSKELAAAAIRNGYKSVSPESDSDAATEGGGTARYKQARKATGRRVPDSDDDEEQMPQLEPQSSDGDVTAVSKRKKSLSEDNACTSKKLPRSAESATGPSETKIFAIILQKLVKHPSSADFEEAVDPAEVPDYYDVIKQPITLAEIKGKISKGAYSTAGAFVSDVTLLFRNAFEYNRVDSDVGYEAQQLEEEFARLLRIHLPSQHYELQYKLFTAAAAATAAGANKAPKRKR